VEGTALLGGLSPPRARLAWKLVSIEDLRPETARAKTLVLDVPDWPGHRAGQHVDIRLTAEDGYQAQRSYSISSAPGNEHLELTVECVDDGEVSPYLTEEARNGDQFELRGPIGGYFVWDGSLDRPLFLVGGGSGLAPLMAMLRYHRDTNSSVPARLLLSVRDLEDVLFRDELESLRGSVGIQITLTRGQAPPGWTGFTGRVDAQMLAAAGPDPAERPGVYVCGPTGFVEHAADLLVSRGHDPGNVYTERFGPTGG
jgi:ferredoxin-NADP reductase